MKKVTLLCTLSPKEGTVYTAQVLLWLTLDIPNTYACPGLAQLVEHLAYRYSKSTGSNHGNFTSAMRIRQPTLALKPRGDVTRNPKQGYQWPQKWTCVRQKVRKKKKYMACSRITALRERLRYTAAVVIFFTSLDSYLILTLTIIQTNINSTHFFSHN